MIKKNVAIAKRWFLEGSNRYADSPIFRAEVTKNITTVPEGEKKAARYGTSLSRLGINKKSSVSSWELAIKLSMHLSKIPLAFYEESDAVSKQNSLVAFDCFSKNLGMEIVNEAKKMINSSFNRSFSKSASRLEHLHEKQRFSPIMKRYIEVAKKRNIPYIPLMRDPAILQLGYGRNSRKVWSALTSKTTRFGAKLTANKYTLNSLLNKLDIPTSNSKMIPKESDLEMLLEQFDLPVVIKPADSTIGKGVSLNIQTFPQAKKAYRAARKISRRVIMESQIEGFYYRLAYVNWKMIANAKAYPAIIIGNGKDKIKKLIDKENKQPYRQEKDKNKSFYKIVLTDKLKTILSFQGLTLNSIPTHKREVMLSFSGADGGEWIEDNASVHPENVHLINRALKFAELDVAGVDVISPDISRPFRENGGKILEINAGPDINIHANVNRGEKINIEESIIDYLFPDNNGRIPVISITGTNGKTTTSKLIAHILNDPSRWTVGLTTSDNKYINGNLVAEGDKSGFLSARSILMNPEVDVAVLETCHILGVDKRGLGYDWSDASVITNLSGDHVGTFCTLTHTDLFNIKSVVAKRTKPDGFLILNADDPQVAKMAALTKAQVAYFGLSKKNECLRHNIKAGNPAYYLENEAIWEEYKGEKTLLSNLKDIPITFNGQAEFNIYNTLGAIAAVRLLFRNKITLSTLHEKLRTFGNALSSNPGRFNIIKKADFEVIVDYAHNPDGYEKTIALAKKIKHKRLVGIIKSAGDRPENFVKELGKIAGQNFDLIYIKEPASEKIRGRKPGKTSQLLKTGVLSTGFPEDKIRIIPDELEAVAHAMKTAEKGDLILIFSHKINHVIDKIISY